MTLTFCCTCTEERFDRRCRCHDCGCFEANATDSQWSRYNEEQNADLDEAEAETDPGGTT